MKQKRPPIVTVLGHVDHGKTTLLDKIRSSSVASSEAGGITQSIGASTVETPSGAITFIDTPGHAAFSSMRARGAKVADVAILVVASDDGVMPQTKEALGVIQDSQVPFIVAITKSDVVSANADLVRSQLMGLGVQFDSQGGQTPCIEISAKTGQGIDLLLETILILSDVNDTTFDPAAPLSCVVVETNKAREGFVVTVVIHDGVLRVGDSLYCEGKEVKVRALEDSSGKKVKEVKAGMGALVLGFSFLPEVGSQMGSSLEVAEKKTKSLSTNSEKESDAEVRIKIILKSSTQGSLEAISASLPEGVHLQAASVGDVTDNDVFLAKTTSAKIVCFEVKAQNSTIKLAESEGVSIMSFRIIYELLDKLEKIVREGDTIITGKAQVLATFPYENKKVAGVKILSGKIVLKDTLVLFGSDSEKQVKVVSMRKYKDEIKEAKEGQECGIILEPQTEFEPGDLLVAIKKQ
jgi:translation initiation factor IF-2